MISIIVPIYNVKPYLKKCLDSIKIQNFTDFEVLLIDDGSTDNPLTIIEDFLLDSRFKYFYKKNGGLSDARNYGIERAKGEYICFIDSDDFISENYLSELINNIGDSSICVCDYFDYSDDNSYTFHSYINKNTQLTNNNYWLSNELTSIQKVVAWNKLYKTSLFRNIRYKVGKYHEDEFIIHYLIHEAKNITVINKPLYYYRQRSNSIMSTNNIKRMIDGYEAILNRMIFFIQNNYPLFINREIDNLFSCIKTIYQSNLEVEDVNRIRLLDSQIKSIIPLLPSLNKTKKYIIKKYKFGSKKVYKTIKNIDNISGFIFAIKHPKLFSYKKILIHKLKTLNHNSVLFIGSPTYGNLGDQAIALSMINFIKQFKLNVIDIPDYLYNSVKSYLNNNISNTIVIVGGGNIGNLYLREENRRREIISTYKNAKIISFPQSPYFTNDLQGNYELNRTISVYNSHKNLILFARDIASKKLMENYFTTTIYITPDIVLSNSIKIRSKKIGNGTVTLMRNDKEKNTNLKINYDNNLDTIVPYIIYPWERKKELFKLLNKIDNYENVITDRLHGMIFSYLLNKDVIAYDNSYHKVSEQYKMITKNYNIKCPLKINKDTKNINLSEFDIIKKKLLEK